MVANPPKPHNLLAHQKVMKTQCEKLGWQAKTPAPRQLAVGQALSPANRSVSRLQGSDTTMVG